MKRGGHATKENASAKLRAWRESRRFKLMSRAAGLKGLEAAKRVPRCNAKAKSTGEPCRLPAMPNGKCRIHGGATPSGAEWHKLRLPARGETRGLAKFEAKAARAKEKRDARRSLALMSPEDRERHQRWHATHAPGSPAERAYRRQQRATRAMINKLLAGDEPGEHQPEVDIFS